MNIRERLAQIQQAHAQHVQLLQQTQANIIRLEGAMEILNEQVTAEETAAAAPIPVTPNRRTRRSAKHLKLVEPAASPAEPAA